MLALILKSFEDKVLVIRYGIAGGTGIVANIITFYIATEVLGIWYLAAAVLAFLVSLAFTFAIQKYWTFKHATGKTHLQFTSYTLVALFNLGANILALYVLVELLSVWPVAAQVVTFCFLALFSFFVNRNVTFSKL